MSRRLLSPHRGHPSSTEDNPYQPTTVYQCNPQQPGLAGNFRLRNVFHAIEVDDIDTCLSDESYTDSQSCTEYYYNDNCPSSCQNHPHNNGGCLSDDSASTRLPILYENDDESTRRFSRNTFASDRSHKLYRNRGPGVHKDPRRVYPQKPPPVQQLYQEINTCDNLGPPRRLGLPVPASQISDRPQSSMSSGVTSAIVDGCGGKCQTFENVCYFFLQLIFMMGILIGASLCIAGLVLRKSAAKNLQVLVYIGALLAIVSGLLLAIQWQARSQTKRRKMAVRNAKRGPIPLETIHPRVQQPLIVLQEGQRGFPQILRPLPPPPCDQQGIPWWRRKDLQ